MNTILTAIAILASAYAIITAFIETNRCPECRTWFAHQFGPTISVCRSCKAEF